MNMTEDMRHNDVTEEEQAEVHNAAYRIWRHLPGIIPLEDVRQSAYLGLLEARETFAHFPGSASYKTWIGIKARGAIQDWLRSIDYLPRQLRSLIKKAGMKASSMGHRLNRRAMPEEVFEEMGEDGAWLAGRMKAQFRLGDFKTLSALSQSDRHMVLQTEDRSFELADIRNDLATMMTKHLNEKQEKVLRLVFFEGMTQKEAGKELGLGEGWIHEIQMAALRILRRAFSGSSGYADQMGHLGL